MWLFLLALELSENELQGWPGLRGWVLPRGRVSVDAENLEDSADQVGIKRRLPRRSAGVAVVSTAEAVAQSDGAAHAAHLPATFEIVVAGTVRY